MRKKLILQIAKLQLKCCKLEVQVRNCKYELQVHRKRITAYTHNEANMTAGSFIHSFFYTYICSAKENLYGQIVDQYWTNC